MMLFLSSPTLPWEKKKKKKTHKLHIKMKCNHISKRLDQRGACSASHLPEHLELFLEGGWAQRTAPGRKCVVVAVIPQFCVSLFLKTKAFPSHFPSCVTRKWQATAPWLQSRILLLEFCKVYLLSRECVVIYTHTHTSKWVNIFSMWEKKWIWQNVKLPLFYCPNSNAITLKHFF